MSDIFLRSSRVKFFDDRDLMFRCSIPKYTEPAPPCMAAVSDSNEPTGAMISISVAFTMQRYGV